MGFLRGVGSSRRSVLTHQLDARMDDTSLEVIMRHYIGLLTPKAQRLAP